MLLKFILLFDFISGYKSIVSLSLSSCSEIFEIFYITYYIFYIIIIYFI